MAAELLVVAPDRDSPFVEADVLALNREIATERIAFADHGGKLGLLRELRRRLRRGEGRALMLWFLAPAYALECMAVARRYSRPVVVVTGGLDVDYVPELRLGGLKWPHNRLRQKLGLRWADVVLSISEYSSERIRALAKPRRLELVPMGVDVARFSPAGAKEPLALTVCFEITHETALLKGLPTVIAAARVLPEVPFVVVGREGRDGELGRLRRSSPANVTFTARFISDDELLDLYRRASVYVQVSAHEGFGLAAAEAMACECVPVVTTDHALGEVVGDTGIRVPYGDAVATAAAIARGLSSPELGREARRRIVEHFTMERRVERLLEILRPLVARH
jgi:glycosyltransferase involved in cell wall biosynthesis